MKYIDLTHTFTDSMPVYPGDPLPSLSQIAEISKDGYTDFQITTGMHVGTHMDAPLHMVEGGDYLNEVDISRFFARGHVIDARHKEINSDLLEGVDIKKGDAILVLTGFAKYFTNPLYYEKYPELSEGFAEKAVALGVSIVGMDIPSPDRSPYRVHKILLGNNILIIENLCNLEELVGVASFEIIALPAKFHSEAAPVRVIAKIV